MLPQEFLQRMQTLLGEEYPDFLQSLERPRAVALRFNSRKGEIPSLSFVKEPVPWEENGYYYDPQARPGLHPFHEAGVYYLQEASAMAPVSLLDPQPGERICDLCAAPGGKTTQIAGRMDGKGFLLCNEIHPKRAKILGRNVERMGVANALVTNEQPEALAARLPGFFDRVLVDAPCSGEGMFRKEEAAVTDWSVDTVRMCAQRQKNILHSAACMVKPGGRLVYSTCTFSGEENEQVIEDFLQNHPEFSPETVAAPWFEASRPGCFRLWPHKLLGEGHFAAVLRKNSGNEDTPIFQTAEKLPQPVQTFLQELNIALPQGGLLSFGQSLYWMPADMPLLQGLKVIRPGLELGLLKKDRFEPAHALALWLQTAANVQELPPDGDEIKAYLHGETISSNRYGWCLVTVGGYSIGWGKGDKNVLKNHYPKGLRR